MFHFTSVNYWSCFNLSMVRKHKLSKWAMNEFILFLERFHMYRPPCLTLAAVEGHSGQTSSASLRSSPRRQASGGAAHRWGSAPLKSLFQKGYRGDQRVASDSSPKPAECFRSSAQPSPSAGGGLPVPCTPTYFSVTGGNSEWPSFRSGGYRKTAAAHRGWNLEVIVFFINHQNNKFQRISPFGTGTWHHSFYRLFTENKQVTLHISVMIESMVTLYKQELVTTSGEK